MIIEDGKCKVECEGVRLRGKNLIVKWHEERVTTEAGIVWTDDLKRYNVGTVLFVSKDASEEVRPGDVIYFSKNCGTDFKFDGVYCLAIKLSDVWGVVQ